MVVTNPSTIVQYYHVVAYVTIAWQTVAASDAAVVVTSSATSATWLVA